MSNVFASFSAALMVPVVAVGTAFGAYQSLHDALPSDFQAASQQAQSVSLVEGIECDIDCMNDFAELANVMVEYYRERRYKTTQDTEQESSHAEGAKKGTGAAGAKPGKESNPLDVDPLFEGRALLRRPSYTTPIIIEERGVPLAVIPATPPEEPTVIYS